MKRYLLIPIVLFVAMAINAPAQGFGWGDPQFPPGRGPNDLPFQNPFTGRNYQQQQPKNKFKDFKMEDILILHKNLEQTAKSLAHNGDNDMLEIAATSKSFQHRIAAAWAMGMRYKPDEKLLNLLTDEHDLVVHAAKQSCIEICKHRYGQALDFGPFPNCAQEEKADSRALWEATFNRYEKIIENVLNAEKAAKQKADPIKKLAAPQKSVAEILEFEKLGIKDNEGEPK